MDARDCLQMLREMKDVAFATVDEEGNPQVRMIDVMLTEGEKLYFLTARGKEFYRQLERDPRVAVTGLNGDWQSVRLSGRARRLAERKKWIDRMFRENPSMEEVYPGDSREILEAFVIEGGEAELFDLGKSPICRYIFSLTAAAKGFRITAACIGCGRCLEVCPQKAIANKRVGDAENAGNVSVAADEETVADEGTADDEGIVSVGVFPVILQEHCLHCGLCVESCPASAIVRRNEK